MKIRNVSPLGELDVPLLRRVVPAGEAVTVTDEQAARLLPQTGAWQPADKAARDLLDALQPAEDAGPVHRRRDQ